MLRWLTSHLRPWTPSYTGKPVTGAGFKLTFPWPDSMPTAKPTPALLELQRSRWRQAKVLDEWRGRSVGIVEKALANREVYERVSESTGVPWWAVAALHNMEASQNFTRHLHNGDPLTSRTTHVPKGRPKTGTAPFTWEASAIDALKFDKMDKVNWGDVGESLQALEAYNGLGYQKYHPTVPTPYLWSGSTLARKGKYAADGVWDANLVSKQLGAATFLKLLIEKGVKVW
jgi:lysozyme family protein